MSDIDLVLAQVDELLRTKAGKQRVVAAIGSFIEAAKRGYSDRGREDRILEEEIIAAENRLSVLAAAETMSEVLITEARQMSIDAMACRRALLPLTSPDRPWITADPRSALFDDADLYSFAVYEAFADSLADEQDNEDS